MSRGGRDLARCMFLFSRISKFVCLEQIIQLLAAFGSFWLSLNVILLGSKWTASFIYMSQAECIAKASLNI
jgi:hypothetical protein